MNQVKRTAFAKKYYYLLVVLGITTVVIVGNATTYNFYFNNVEQQGDNSTATPTFNANGKDNTPVKLEDVKPEALKEEERASDAPKESEETPEETQKALSPSAAEASSVATVQPAKERRKRFRFLMNGLVGATHYDSDYQNDFLNKGVMGNVSYFANRHIGFGVGAGWMKQHEFYKENEGFSMSLDNRAVYAAELHLVPVHVALFGVQDVFDLEFSLGVNNIARDVDNQVSLHAGARLNLNMGSDGNFILTAGGRGNLGFWAADAGLGFRF